MCCTDRCGEHGLRGPNDIVFDAQGGFYFSDLGKSRARDRDHGGLYYAWADGSRIVEVAYPILTPNGVGLWLMAKLFMLRKPKPRGSGRSIWRRRAWRASSPSVAAWRPAGGRARGLQRFDSLALDAAGNICVATLISGCISVIAPDGRVLRQVPTGDPATTNICFGGPDLRTAYVTLSGTGRLVAFDWPEAGLPLAHQV